MDHVGSQDTVPAGKKHVGKTIVPGMIYPGIANYQYRYLRKIRYCGLVSVLSPAHSHHPSLSNDNTGYGTIPYPPHDTHTRSMPLKFPKDVSTQLFKFVRIIDLKFNRTLLSLFGSSHTHGGDQPPLPHHSLLSYTSHLHTQPSIVEPRQLGNCYGKSRHNDLPKRIPN